MSDSLIENPIIIVGTGRSGSTLFHNLLGEHPNLAWLSPSIASKYREKPHYSKLLMDLIDAPVLGNLLKRKFKPGESYWFWENHVKGFMFTFRDLVAADVTLKHKKNVNKAMSIVLTRKRSRLLLKITGWPRIGFINEIFKEPLFIHIIRDGRAVTNSIMDTFIWRGWWGTERWRWGKLPEKYQKEWEKYDKSFHALGAIQWKLLIDSLNQAKKYVPPSRFMEIRYEDLCESPISILKNVASFCSLEWSDSFEEKINKYNFINTNYKWEEFLTNKQKEIINDVLYDYLEKYNYI